MDENFAVTIQAIVPKLMRINHLVNETTIGPNSLINQSKPSSGQTNEMNTSIHKTPEYKACETENHLPTREFKKVLDLQRQTQFQSCLNNRLQIFNQFDSVQKTRSKETWLKSQQQRQEDVKRIEADILLASQQFELQLFKHQAIIAQQTQMAVQRMKDRQEQIKEKERQKKKLLEHFNEIRSNQQKFYKEWQEIVNIIKKFEDVRKALVSKVDLSLLQSLPNEIGTIVEKCKIKDGIMQNNISEQDVNKSYEILSKATAFKTVLLKLYLEYSQERQHSSQDNNKTEITGTGTNKENVTEVAKKIERPAIVNTPDREIKAVDKSTFDQFISLNDLQLYSEIIDFLKNYRNLFSELERNESLKHFRFDLKKAINIPVNSLSGVNPEHITDKYQKLFSLLKGQTVIINGKEVNALKHPQGIAFCTDLLAKKFVLQGDLMVSSNPESAFCYASVILSLWNDFPDFGKLLLGYFYTYCPYLVPYYVPKQAGETDEEFYKKLGYLYTDGEVEKQDKFLKRMTGILKLYFALLISKPKRSHTRSPHNIMYGWKWLASFLRLEPQIDITSTALHVFLETVGFAMDEKYGKMFHKVLKIIIQVFLPKCQQVHCTGGATTRLELLLTEYLKTKTFIKPNGYKEYPVW